MRLVIGRIVATARAAGSLRVPHAGLAVRVVATVAGIALLAHGVDLRSVGHALATARLEWLLVGTALTGLTLLGAVVQWGALLRGHASVSWRRLAAVYARSLFVGHVVPGGFGGDASLTVELGPAHGHAAVVASLIASRLAGCVAMATWSVVGAAWLVPELGVAPVAIAGGVFVVLVTIAALAVSARARWRWTWLAELSAALCAQRRNSRRVTIAFGLALAGWGVNLLALEAFARSVGGAIPWAVLAVTVPAALTVTVLPVSINGLGLREGLLVALALHAGVAPAAAAALAVLVDLQPLPFALAGGVMWLTRERRAQTRRPGAHGQARPVRQRTETIVAM